LGPGSDSIDAPAGAPPGPEAPPGLGAPCFPPGSEPSSLLFLPPGLDAAKVDNGDISDGASDDTSAGFSSSTSGWHSETASTWSDSEFDSSDDARGACSEDLKVKAVATFQVDAPEFVPSARRTRTALKSKARSFKPQLSSIPSIRCSRDGLATMACGPVSSA